MNDDEEPREQQVGKAEAGEPAQGHPAAMLWLPDPECWRGWSLHRVERKERAKGDLGFRQTPRPRGR